MSDLSPIDKRSCLVSVILPTRNRLATLPRAIDSVLGQTFGDFELIIIDDGSTDGTDKLIASYADPRIRYYFNSGMPSISRARNMGLSLAKGTYIAFQDSDDEWLPRKLEMQVSALNSLTDDVALVYGPNVKQYADGRVSTYVRGRFSSNDADIFPKVFMEGIGGVQTILVRREVFDIVGTFDEDIVVAEDTDLLFRMARRYRFQYLPEQFVRIYETKGSLMSKHDTIYSSWQKILDKCAQELADDPRLLVHGYHVSIRLAAQASRRREAFALLWKLFLRRAVGLYDLGWAAVALTSPKLVDWTRKARTPR